MKKLYVSVIFSDFIITFAEMLMHDIIENNKNTMQK